MKSLIKAMIVVSALTTAGFAAADPPAPGTVTVHPTVIVGNPRRPVVTIEISRQRPDIPLHVLSHPLDRRPAAVPSPQ